MTRSEREISYFWFSGRVSLCFSFEKEFQVSNFLLTWGGFADDMEKFRGNLGRGKINRT